MSSHHRGRRGRSSVPRGILVLGIVGLVALAGLRELGAGRLTGGDLPLLPPPVRTGVHFPITPLEDAEPERPPLIEVASTIPSVPQARAPAPPMPTPVAVPRSTRYSPTPLVLDPDLAARVLDRLAGRSAKFGVAIKDLKTGYGVLIDPDGEYQAASLFKLWVMYEVFKQRELGVLSFEEVLVLTERHVAYDLGTLDRPAGSTIELGEALERMITISDNSSAILLTDRVGALNINRDLRGLGLEHSRLRLHDLVTSPADVLTLLEMLARGEAVSPGASAEMVQLLSRQRIRDRIPRLLPPATIVSNKTGNLPGVVNDVGIIYGPNGAFIVAVLADQAADERGAAQATAELAAIAHEHFAAQAAAGPSIAFPTAAPAAPGRPAPVAREPTPGLTAAGPESELGGAQPALKAESTPGPTPTPTATAPPTATLAPYSLPTPTATPTTATATPLIQTALPASPGAPTPRR